MTGIATGVFKKLSLKRQTALGTIAPAGAGGTAQYQRRVTSTVDLSKATFKSAEILASQQHRDFRHGIRKVGGNIKGELSVGGYQKQFESICRQVVQAGGNTGATALITAASTGTNTGTFTRSAGSYIGDGHKIGDVVNFGGWTAPAIANNSHNMMITALTATVMTVLTLDGQPVVAKAAGDNVTCALVGKKTWVPVSGQTRDYYTIEHWFSDIAQSEYFSDCVFTGATINLPPAGMAEVDFPVMGLNINTGVAEYFTTPAAAPTGGVLASVNGALLVQGVPIAVVTGMTIVIAGNYTMPGGVVGSNVDADIFPGVLEVSGQLTVLFKDNTYRDLFLNETEASIAVALTASNAANAGCMAFVMSRVKFSGATKDDGTAGLALTMPYTALENVSGSAVDLDTTISIQDSAFA